MYNEHHRQGHSSKYTWENVAIVPGGRAGLIRIAAVLNQAYLGFFIPDYTAYNEMLSLFRNVSLIRPPLLRFVTETQESDQCHHSSLLPSLYPWTRRTDTISTQV